MLRVTAVHRIPTANSQPTPRVVHKPKAEPKRQLSHPKCRRRVEEGGNGVTLGQKFVLECPVQASRPAQPFRPLDRTCSAQLLALPLRALTGSSRLFLHSPWLPAAFSQGSFPQTPDHPRPSTVRRPSTSTAPRKRAHAPSTTDAHRRASTVSRWRVWSGGPRQVAPCSRSAVARAAGPRPQPEPLARLPPTPGRARVGCFAGGREWGGQPPRYRSPPPGPDAAYMLGH